MWHTSILLYKKVPFLIFYLTKDDSPVLQLRTDQAWSHFGFDNSTSLFYCIKCQSVMDIWHASKKRYPDMPFSLREAINHVEIDPGNPVILGPPGGGSLSSSSILLILFH